MNDALKEGTTQALRSLNERMAALAEDFGVEPANIEGVAAEIGRIADKMIDPTLDMYPGETIVWHVGYLAKDRLKDARLDRLAEILLKKALPRGFVYSIEHEPIDGTNEGFLTQRKLAPNQYAYLYTKRKGKPFGRRR
jgi:hypothetical protein